MTVGSEKEEGAGRSGSPHSVATDPRSVLTTIYTALALGVGVLAVVFYILGPSIGSTFGRSLFRWIWLAAALVCTLGAGVVRGRASSVSPDRGSLLPAAIITWSLAEAQALLAAVGFFLTGDRPLLVAGLALFIFLMARHRPSTFLAGS